MNKHSIFLPISIVLVISLVSIAIIFASLRKYQLENIAEQIESKYRIATRFIPPFMLFFPKEEELKERFEPFNLKLINKKEIKNNIVRNGETIHNSNHLHIELNTIKYDNNLYLHIKKTHRRMGFMQNFRDDDDDDNDDNDDDKSVYNILLQDTEGYDKRNPLALLTTILFVALIISFITIIKKIYPLKKLQKEVIRFGDGEENINCKSTKKDEIGQLANEFDKAVNKINDLTNARNLFLRNIMHELKTPITKGKLCTELIKKDRNKEILSSVFTRLENLINEFARIEQLNSQNYNLSLKEYRLIDIIDHAIDLLYIDKKQVILKGNEQKILFADFELISISIKNLIDNAIKYSEDKKVSIETKDKELIFKSKGKALKYPFEQYLQPFFKMTVNEEANGEMNEEEDNNSLGLGLYITNSILKAHRFNLKYKHTEKENIFKILFEEEIEKRIEKLQNKIKR